MEKTCFNYFNFPCSFSKGKGKIVRCFLLPFSVASTVPWLLFGGDFGYCGSRRIRQESRTFDGKPK